MVHLPPSVKVPSMCDKVIMIVIVIGQYLHKVFMLRFVGIFDISYDFHNMLSSDCCCCCFSSVAGHYKEGKRAFVVLLVSSAQSSPWSTVPWAFDFTFYGWHCFMPILFCTELVAE